MTTAASTINAFWFDKENEPYWFVRNDSFDRRVKEQLQGFYEQALLGDDDAWRGNSRDMLALIILFDQVPRNLFRSNAKAFATDVRARTLTRHALNHHDLSPLTTKERLFIYIPLQHSEDLHDQQDSCRLYATLNDKQALGLRRTAPRYHRAIRTLPSPQQSTGTPIDTRRRTLPQRQRKSVLIKAASGWGSLRLGLSQTEYDCETRVCATSAHRWTIRSLDEPA